MHETTIEILTAAGYKKLRVYPTSVVVGEKALTAEVLEDPGIPSFDALMLAWRAALTTMFRIDGEEIECYVEMSAAPTLERGKAMVRVLRLTRPR